MSCISIESLAITKLCLEEMLQDKIELESANNLQDSVNYGLDLSIKNLKDVIEMINDRLEDMEILDIVEERMKNDDGIRYTLADVKCYINDRKTNKI